jgi:hypothetical protein
VLSPNATLACLGAIHNSKRLTELFMHIYECSAAATKDDIDDSSSKELHCEPLIQYGSAL